MPKFCSKCKVELPQGHNHCYCPPCKREYYQRYCKENADKYRAYSRRYRERNLEKCQDRERRYKETHREAERERSRRYRMENLEKRRESDRRFYESHKDERRQTARRYRESSRDKIREKERRYAQTNAAKLAAKTARRRAKKRAVSVGVVDYAAVIERSQGLCVLCRAVVPDGLRHFDHIIPLDKDGPHYTENLQLLCYRCNCSKGAKLPDEVTPPRWQKKPDPEKPYLLNPDWR